VSATHDRAGRKLLITANGLTHGLALIGVGQTGINALPQRLCERDLLGEWQCHRFGRELLSGHGEKVAIQAASVNTGQERGQKPAKLRALMPRIQKKNLKGAQAAY
jgi:hypothetical protein